MYLCNCVILNGGGKFVLIFLCNDILQELTSTAGEDVVLAMNSFIKRLLAVSDPSQMKV